MCVLYRNPNCWMDLNEIGTEVVLVRVKFLGGFWPRTTTPQGTGPQQGVRSASRAFPFLGILTT